MWRGVGEGLRGGRRSGSTHLVYETSTGLTRLFYGPCRAWTWRVERVWGVKGLCRVRQRKGREIGRQGC